MTTDRCNLSCVMCPFNGPGAPRKTETLDPKLVFKFMREIPRGQELWFAGTGEFFMDPHALNHLQLASHLGHEPRVLTNGQRMAPSLIDAVLESGVRQIRFSVDAIDPQSYAHIRRGGSFEDILRTCMYVRSRKPAYPGLRVEVNNTLFKDTIARQSEFVRFWRGKVDQVNFNAEYYDIFNFRNLFFTPGTRVGCQLSLYLLPSGRLSPCCAVNVYQHYNSLGVRCDAEKRQ